MARRHRLPLHAHALVALIGLLDAAVGGASAGLGSGAPRASTESRLAGLEAILEQQARRIGDLERVAPKEFELLHYNVLADQAGTNMQPWFCYGASVSQAERRELHRRFYEDGHKFAPNKGWPGWAVGVLSPERIAAVEEYDRHIFAWQSRRERLWDVVREHSVGCRVRSPDIVTLAECDHFHDFWEGRFTAAGYGALWRKRPRESSRDGCAIAWRESTFELVAEGGFDFGSTMASRKPDRTCAFALLRWRRDPSVRLLVATTHLMRDPESDDAQLTRGFQ